MWALRSLTRDGTHVGRWSLNHWTNGDVPALRLSKQLWVGQQADLWAGLQSVSPQSLIKQGFGT